MDVSDAALTAPDYLISISDFEAWESRYGTLPKGAIVILKTGFYQFWPDRECYMGTAEKGPEAVARLHFSGLGPEAAEWLVKKRDIRAIGIDTPRIDYANPLNSGPIAYFPKPIFQPSRMWRTWAHCPPGDFFLSRCR